MSLLKDIERYCQEKATGTLLISAGDDSGQVGYIQGNIIGARYQKLHGLAALKALIKLASDGLRDTSFWRGKPVVSVDELFNNQNILVALQDTATPDSPSQQDQPPATSAAGLSTDELSEIKRQLLNIIGPFGHKLIAPYQQAIESGETIERETLIQHLVVAIDDAEISDEFLQNIQR